MMDLGSIATIVGPTVLLTAGAAWGATKQALNGTKDRITKLDRALETHLADANNIHRELLQRTSSVEAKIDILLTQGKT